jgi:hypothetical protein
MNRADQLVDRAADRLQRLADDFAAQGGSKVKLAEELAEDAAFVRKLKPSLMLARWRGDAPTNMQPAKVVVAPSGPQLGKRPKPPRQRGPSPFLVVGVAFAAGIVVAKLIDWRGHAHPRD